MRLFFQKTLRLAASSPILLVLAALCVGGIFVIISATYANKDLEAAPVAQGYYALLGLLLYLGLAYTPYSAWVKLAPYLYGVSILLLIAVFVPHIGWEHYGAKSWIKIKSIRFEPAEFAKIAFILGLAWYLQVMEKKTHELRTVLLAVAFALIPFFLIKKQPALGSACVFLPICFAMLFAAGTRKRYVVIPVAVLALCLTTLYYWVHVWQKEIPFLADFQQQRIKIFFDPSLDKKGAAWQISQSMIAIGSGGMDGKGWRQGTENVLGYLPSKTTYNDFIFAVVGEDFGFIGGASLIVGEGIVLLWCLVVAANARDKSGALIAIGVMALLLTHVFVNVGMTIQVVPITGIPLPFISYGGTFLVACLAAMGLVQSVWIHRKNFARA